MDRGAFRERSGSKCGCEKRFVVFQKTLKWSWSFGSFCIKAKWTYWILYGWLPSSNIKIAWFTTKLKRGREYFTCRLFITLYIHSLFDVFSWKASGSASCWKHERARSDKLYQWFSIAKSSSKPSWLLACQQVGLVLHSIAGSSIKM